MRQQRPGSAGGGMVAVPGIPPGLVRGVKLAIVMELCVPGLFGGGVLQWAA